MPGTYNYVYLMYVEMYAVKKLIVEKDFPDFIPNLILYIFYNLIPPHCTAYLKLHNDIL